MKILNIAILIILVFSAGCEAAPHESDGGTSLVFHGASDASGAVSVGKDMFVVADDENNTLRVYKTKDRSLAVASLDIARFLGTTTVHPEADIEGATKVGDTVYWITSHGRNKNGEIRPNRYRFFATTVKMDGDKVTIEPFGFACRNLMQKLMETGKVKDLERATQFNVKLKKKQRKRLAPKVSGLNIEGLCVSRDKKTMYIGIRNPIPFDSEVSLPRAIVVPLANYKEVIAEKAEPVFGEAIRWDLHGLGVRSMEYSDAHKMYFIVAGPYDSRREFVLYKWSGKESETPKPVQRIETDGGDFNPEAIIPFENSKKLLLLSDDGTIPHKVSTLTDCMEGELLGGGMCPNKYLTNDEQKSFRGIWVTP